MLETFLQTDLTLGPLFATFLLGFTTFVLLIWYSHRKQAYWEKKGLPFVSPLPLLGSTLDLWNKPMHYVDLDRFEKYGRIYGHYEGNNPVLSIGEPEILRQIFVKDFHAFTGRREFPVADDRVGKMMSIVRGEDWKRIRTIVTPTFSTGKIKRMLGIFKECSQTLVENFKQSAEKKEPIEVKRYYGTFTMDVIASSAFSTKIDSHNDPENPFVQTAREVFSRNINWRFIIFLLFPFLVKVLKIQIFSAKALDFFTNVTLQIIEERKKTGQVRNDFLQLLLDTAKEVSHDKADVNEKDDIVENYGNEETDQIFKQNSYTKKSLSSDEVIAQCVIFFLAGYDTTASTMSFVSYNLALHPDIQEKLIKEIDDALKENQGDLTYEAIQSMKYLDNVISETLRLFPPAVRIERMADEDYEIKELGLTIPKNMIVSVPVYAIHRDPKFYHDPEKFDPTRFTPEERGKRDLYVYLPFGHGPRNCVGMRFALMEIKVCLALVLSNFRFKTCSKTKVPVDYYIGQGLLQPKEIFLQLESRKDAVRTT